jgi:hypothetical protein
MWSVRQIGAGDSSRCASIPFDVRRLGCIHGSGRARVVHLVAIIEILGSSLCIRGLGSKPGLDIRILCGAGNSPITKTVMWISIGEAFFQHSIVIPHDC